MAARADKLFSPSLTKTRSIFVSDEVLWRETAIRTTITGTIFYLP